MVTRHAVTAEELAQMPDNGQRTELIDGELITMPMAKPDHSWVGLEICRLIGNYVYERGLGEVFPADTGFQLSRFPDTVLAPDASFVSAERLPPMNEWNRHFKFAPDLAFEILSPSNTAREMADKTRRYFEAGSIMVIIVDPRSKSVDVHTSHAPVQHLSPRDELDLDAVVPGLSIPISAIFRRLIDSP